MTAQLQNISEHWGWFVDIEDNIFIKDFYTFKKPSINLKALPTIKEYEYEDEYYYHSNQYNNKGTNQPSIINKQHTKYYNHIYLTSLLILCITSYVILNCFKI